MRRPGAGSSDRSRTRRRWRSTVIAEPSAFVAVYTRCHVAKRLSMADQRPVLLWFPVLDPNRRAGLFICTGGPVCCNGLLLESNWGLQESAKSGSVKKGSRQTSGLVKTRHSPDGGTLYVRGARCFRTLTPVLNAPHIAVTFRSNGWDPLEDLGFLNRRDSTGHKHKVPTKQRRSKFRQISYLLLGAVLM